MLPLNKPLISYSGKRFSVDSFVSRHFKHLHYHVTFSARQGLWEAYGKIKKERGVQNVAVSPLTCIEAIYPIIEHGHKIHFVDINPATLNMDEQLIPENIDVVQVIHFGGNPQDMSIVAEKKPKLIVEDCAQGFGSYFNDKHVGNFGHFASFSFMKNFYSLGGGLVLFSEQNRLENLNYANFGFASTAYRYMKRKIESKCSARSIVPDSLLKAILSLKPDQTTEIINNSSVNSLIFKSIERQLGIADIITDRRSLAARSILSGLNNANLVPQAITNFGKSNFLRLFLVLQKGYAKDAISKLRHLGIGANHLTQNHLSYYQERFDRNEKLMTYIDKKQLKCYFDLHDQVISIPVSPALSNLEIDYIVSSLNNL